MADKPSGRELGLRIVGAIKKALARQKASFNARIDHIVASVQTELHSRPTLAHVQASIELAVAKLQSAFAASVVATIDDFELAMEDRTLTISMSIGGRMVSKSVHVPLPYDAGVYKSGQAYDKGAMVTFSGSAFIASRDASSTEKPEASSAWRLLVKRGRDGKDGSAE